MAGLTKLHFTNKAAHFEVKITLGKQNLVPKDFRFCQKNFRFFANNYCIGMFVETSSWTPGGIVWRKKILGKISIICSHLSTFFGFRSMFFLILVQISRQGHQKVFSTCPDEQFEKGYSAVFKNFQFCIFCIKKYLWRKPKFENKRQYYILVARRIFWEKSFRETNFLLFNF